jgi:hypothetical protein
MYCHLGGPILDHIKELVFYPFGWLPNKTPVGKTLFSIPCGERGYPHSLQGECIPVPHGKRVSFSEE